MTGLKWNTGKLYYSTVELGYQQGALFLFVRAQSDHSFMVHGSWSKICTLNRSKKITLMQINNAILLLVRYIIIIQVIFL
jgi:hypothetical protein